MASASVPSSSFFSSSSFFRVEKADGTKQALFSTVYSTISSESEKDKSLILCDFFVSLVLPRSLSLSLSQLRPNPHLLDALPCVRRRYNTTHVGLAVSDDGTYVVANYSPPGNYLHDGEFEANVLVSSGLM